MADMLQLLLRPEVTSALGLLVGAIWGAVVTKRVLTRRLRLRDERKGADGRE